MRELTRRQALGAAAATFAATAVDPPRGLAAAARRRDALHRAGRFASGVASGDPAPGRILLWTSLTGAEGPGTVAWEVAEDEGFRRVVATGRGRCGAVRDFTVHADVRSRRLRPDRPYWYRFHTATAQSPVGRFRTLPPPDSRAPVRIGVYSCQDYENGFYAAHRAMAAEDLHLVVCVGDYIYERAAPGGVRQDRTGTNGDGEAQTLAEYRQKYRLYQSDPDLQAMHASHAHLAFWDSHDVETVEGPSPDVDQYGKARRVPLAERTRAGMLAFLEHLPQRHPRARVPIYRTLRIGRTAELLLTDETLHHSPYPCAFSFPPQPCPQADDPALTMLGATQKAWLKDRLRASQATWKLYLGGTMMMGLELGQGRPFNVAQWDGFRAERQELCEFLLAEGVRDVVRLSGDIHTFFAGQVTTTGRAGGLAAAVELIGGALSSETIAEGLVNRSGLPVDPDLTAIVSDRLPVLNPHLAFAETRRQGYKVVEARQDGLTATFRAVADVRRADSATLDLARFAVPRGRPEVRRLA